MTKFIKYAIYLYILISSLPTFAFVLNDKGKINSTVISNIIQVKSESDIIQAINEAHKKNLPIAMMGKQHSQGGQSLAPKAIELDMLPFHKVLDLDIKKKQITVQTGMTWGEIQSYINSYNLSIMAMQSPNIFSIGGSISVNAHGDGFRTGSVGNSLVAFHLRLANGEKKLITPKTYPELWNAVIGGYGLLGVIEDVTLQLNDNEWLKGHYYDTNIDHFADLFQNKILNDPDVRLFYARLKTAPGLGFLHDMYIITHSSTHTIPDAIVPLKDPDRWNILYKPLFNFSRHSDFGKTSRWELEKLFFRTVNDNRLITKNNAMEEPVKFASEYDEKNSVDWLQEYFIPLDQFKNFVDELREVIRKNKVNLLNITIRYVIAEPEILLSYAKTNCISLVIYFNQNLSESSVKKTQLWTEQLINTVLRFNGSYYLTYQNFATEDQFIQAYPGYKKFLAVKKQYDKDNLFTNHFYRHYF